MKKPTYIFIAALFCFNTFLSTGMHKITVWASQATPLLGAPIQASGNSSGKPASINDYWRQKYSDYIKDEKARSTPTPQRTSVPPSRPLPAVYIPPLITAPPTPTITASPTPKPSQFQNYGMILQYAYISNISGSGFTLRFAAANSVIRSDTTVSFEYAGNNWTHRLTDFIPVSSDSNVTVYETTINLLYSVNYYLNISIRDYLGNAQSVSVPMALNTYVYPQYTSNGSYAGSSNDPYYNSYYGNIWSPFLPITAPPVETAAPTPEVTPTATPSPTASPTASPTPQVAIAP